MKIEGAFVTMSLEEFQRVFGDEANYSVLILSRRTQRREGAPDLYIQTEIHGVQRSTGDELYMKETINGAIVREQSVPVSMLWDFFGVLSRVIRKAIADEEGADAQTKPRAPPCAHLGRIPPEL